MQTTYVAGTLDSARNGNQEISASPVESKGYRLFPQENQASAYLMPWKDSTAFPKPAEDLYATSDGFWELHTSHDSILFYGWDRAADSITHIIRERLAIILFEGNEHFSTLDGKKMEDFLVFGGKPTDGFTYQIAGKDGELIPAPLVFDSLQANHLVQEQEDSDAYTEKTTVWRATSGDPALVKTIASLRGHALVIGSKSPLRNSAVKPVPISDSLKLGIMKSLMPDESMHGKFSSVNFYSAGSEGSKARCLVNFLSAIDGQSGYMYAVEVENGKCVVLFRVNHDYPKFFQFFFSLTESPMADVFVVYIAGNKWAILKSHGKWVGIPI